MTEHVLTPGDTLDIAPGISVMLMETRGNHTCRVGITAPREVTILRKEVADDGREVPRVDEAN